MDKTKVYAARIKDEEALLKSSSGGAFTAISDVFLNENNALVCSVYDYALRTTRFALVTTKSERDAARGSKYMQSKSGNIYKDALEYLKAHPDKHLLFVGTGCQAEGFRKFAEVSGVRDRVWIVDIICHGVPSPKIYREYAAYIEKKQGGKISSLVFKDKRIGWENPVAVAVINGREYFIKDYSVISYNRCILRPCCHQCPFVKIERRSDMTIGDFWHIDEKLPNFYDKRGTSLLLIHTDRGKQLFEKIKAEIDFRESNTTDCWQYNLEKATPASAKRGEFWSDYRKHGINYIILRYGFVVRACYKLKKIIGGGITLTKTIQPVVPIPSKGGRHDELEAA